MGALYRRDLAYIQAVGFGDFARRAAPEIVRVLRSAAIPVRRVIDAGCGAGPIAAALMECGFEVTGIDVSAERLSLAHVACPSARFIHGSIYEQEIPACEAIVAIGEPLTYHDGEDAEARVGDFFRPAHDALPGGGRLIFDVIELGEPPLSAGPWRSGDDWAVLANVAEEQNSRILVREIETFRKIGQDYRRGREVHRVRLFDSAEVCGWLERAGFSVRTAPGYGEFRLPPRRRAFFCTRR